MTPEPPVPELVRGFQFLTRTRAGRVTGVVFLSALVVLVGAISWLSYNGFCVREKRFLSAEEYVNAAINEIIREPTYQQIIDAPGVTRFMSLKVIQYKDVEEFQRQNPNCCKVVSHNNGPWPTFEERLLGGAAVVVSVEYIVKFIGENGNPQSTAARSFYAVRNCGSAWNARH